ncbi:MAG: hypothetical protein HF978_12145 [Desulfobacteraceae bacterium]|nr:hypothetical protein [Desulfobacteraceae bacterium]MBC2756288.1 hypothetical protein [Desulfobacteraceae bacterium]
MAIPLKIRKPSEDEINKRVKNSIEVASKNKSAPHELKIITQRTGDVRKKEKIAGRPVKPENEKLSEKVLISFTKEEYTKLDKLSRVKYGIAIPVPVLIRGLLKETDII